MISYLIFPKSSLWQNVKGSSEMELQINKFVEYWKSVREKKQYS